MNFEKPFVLFLLIALMPTQTLSQDQFRDQFFTSGNARVHFIEAGVGEPVILHHGNTGSVNGWLRTGVFQALSENYRVIAMDARGHGKSDKPHDVESYGKEMSDDIIRLMDHLDIDKAHIIGYSMGTRIFAKALTNQEDRFLTAVFGGFAPDWDWTQEDEDQVKLRSEQMMTNPPQRLVDQGQDTTALATLVLGFSELAVTEAGLKSLSLPTMAIVGSEDFLYESVIEFSELLPRMKLVVIEGATHGEAFGRPEFVESVQEFLLSSSGN